ncbi:helix-turn-helix domain-containing protein [Paenibacillus sp. MBLB4367]|uniref:helix-turn-helix domain-containing protein n=1 Tax=Paenibacillus sp. MBLB4367 TaxID=3384767 RepID=UPI00390812A4
MTDDFAYDRRKVTEAVSMTANHFHDTYEVYYLCSGERYYFIKNRTYHVKAGDIVFIGKNELHKTTEAYRPVHERLLINFHDRFLMPNWEHESKSLQLPFHGTSNVLRLEEADRRIALELLLGIEKEWQARKQGAELFVQALLTQLLVFCARLMPSTGIESVERTGPQERKIGEIVAYINNHFDRPLSLQHISRTFFISPYHFSRLFRDITGFTFIEYVNNVRVMEARRLLRESGEPVIRVAERSGFDSIAHFGRVFKQIARCSPTAFRKESRRPE